MTDRQWTCRRYLIASVQHAHVEPGASATISWLDSEFEPGGRGLRPCIVQDLVGVDVADPGDRRRRRSSRSGLRAPLPRPHQRPTEVGPGSKGSATGSTPSVSRAPAGSSLRSATVSNTTTSPKVPSGSIEPQLAGRAWETDGDDLGVRSSTVVPVGVAARSELSDSCGGGSIDRGVARVEREQRGTSPSGVLTLRIFMPPRDWSMIASGDSCSGRATRSRLDCDVGRTRRPSCRRGRGPSLVGRSRPRGAQTSVAPSDAEPSFVAQACAAANCSASTSSRSAPPPRRGCGRRPTRTVRVKTLVRDPGPTRR